MELPLGLGKTHLAYSLPLCYLEQQLPTSSLPLSGRVLGIFQTPERRKCFLSCKCKDWPLSRSTGSGNAVSLQSKPHPLQGTLVRSCGPDKTITKQFEMGTFSKLWVILLFLWSPFTLKRRVLLLIPVLPGSGSWRSATQPMCLSS